jgi:hypothetical protein
MVYGLAKKDADPRPGTAPGPGDRLCYASLAVFYLNDVEAMALITPILP